MGRWLGRILFLVLLAGLVWLLRLTVFAREPVPVRVARVERGTVEAAITNSRAGTVKARRRAKLSTGTSGIVVELHARRGARVGAGDVLLRLDDATQRAAWEEATRAVEVARARVEEVRVAVEQAERDLARRRALPPEAAVPAEELERLENALDQARARLAVAEAETRRAEAACALAKAELDKTVLRAPFDAVLAEVSVEVGEWVTPSVPLLAAPDLIDAYDPGSLYVAAPMDEVDTALVEPGREARVTFDPYPDRAFAGRVTHVAPYVLDIERQNRTLEIEVELDHPEEVPRLLPGTSADVEVVLDRKEDVLRIPSHALIEGERVLVLEDERLAERQVEVGLSNWDWTEITGGLAEGDAIVVSLDRPEVVAGAEAVVEDDGDGR